MLETRAGRSVVAFSLRLLVERPVLGDRCEGGHSSQCVWQARPPRGWQGWWLGRAGEFAFTGSSPRRLVLRCGEVRPGHGGPILRWGAGGWGRRMRLAHNGLGVAQAGWTNTQPAAPAACARFLSHGVRVRPAGAIGRHRGAQPCERVRARINLGLSLVRAGAPGCLPSGGSRLPLPGGLHTGALRCLVFPCPSRRRPRPKTRHTLDRALGGVTPTRRGPKECPATEIRTTRVQTCKVEGAEPTAGLPVAVGGPPRGVWCHSKLGQLLSFLEDHSRPSTTRWRRCAPRAVDVLGPGAQGDQHLGPRGDTEATVEMPLRAALERYHDVASRPRWVRAARQCKRSLCGRRLAAHALSRQLGGVERGSRLWTSPRTGFGHRVDGSGQLAPLAFPGGSPSFSRPGGLIAARTDV